MPCSVRRNFAPPSNQDSLLCFDCVKACPKHNVGFRLRKPLQGLWQRRNHTLPNALLVTILPGIIIEEVGEEWAAFEAFSTAVPNTLIQLGVPGSLFGYSWLTAVWLNFLLPFLVLGVTAGVAWLIGRQGTVKQVFQRYALSFVPIVFSLHLAKLWHKFNTKLGLLQFTPGDPGGQQTAAALADKTLSAPGPAFMPAPAEGVFLLLLLALGVLGTLYAIYRIMYLADRRVMPKRTGIPFAITAVSLGALFALVIANWYGFVGG